MKIISQQNLLRSCILHIASDNQSQLYMVIWCITIPVLVPIYTWLKIIVTVPVHALARIISEKSMEIRNSFKNVVCKNAILFWSQRVNSFLRSDAAGWHRSGRTSAQVMACCLAAPAIIWTYVGLSSKVSFTWESWAIYYQKVKDQRNRNNVVHLCETKLIHVEIICSNRLIGFLNHCFIRTYERTFW